MDKWRVLQHIETSGIVAVIRAERAEQAKDIADACIHGGIRITEVTYTVPGATDLICRLKEAASAPPLIVGAGTVLDAETARMAILAGADFVVGPNFDAETARVCNRYAVPYLPGCMTITEMVHAMEAGCDILKLFPGSAFAPSFVKDVKGPLPQVRLMPTGGVSLDNVKDWMRSGVVAVGVGGQLTQGTPDHITKTAQQFVQTIREAREERSRW